MLETLDVIVVDTNKLFRAGVVSLLSRVTRNVHEAADIDALQDQVRNGSRFGLALLDFPAGSPMAHIARVRAALPQCRIAVLSDELNSEKLKLCFAGGADGFLLKDISADTLIESLRLLALGEKVFPSSLASLLSGTHNVTPAADWELPLSGLSVRELDILHCLVDGDSNKRIANRLNITEATVKVHLKSILRKTRAANRTQAAIWALERGLRERKEKETAQADNNANAPVFFKTNARIAGF